MSNELDYFKLMRSFWDWAFENPEIVKPNHCALLAFSVEHCNRLGWKSKFGLPTTMAMEAIGIKSYNTYIKTLNELVDFGFISMVQKSKNQYSANIIALSDFDKALDKALDKAFIKHTTKHVTKQSESTVQSIDSVDKQDTSKQINKLTINKEKERFTPPSVSDVGHYMNDKGLSFDEAVIQAESFVDYYINKNWKVGKSNTQMKDWQAAVRNWLKNDFNKPKNLGYGKQKHADSPERQQIREIAKNVDQSDW